MKRINLTIVLTILLVLSIPFVSFAEATIGGALIEGSGVDPRTDSRYKENYELDTSNPIGSAISKGSPKYGDVVVSFIDYVIERDSSGANVEKPYRLKAYIRYWYDDNFDDIAKPCLLFEENKSINGSDAIYDVLTFRMGSSQTKSPSVNMTNCYEDYTGIFNVRQIKDNTQSCYAFDYYSSKRDVEIISSDFLIFSNSDDANYYETTGIIKNAIYNPADDPNVTGGNITAGQIYLEDFQVIYHDAPSLDDCYVEFKYSIPKHLRNVRGSLYLDVTDLYRAEASVVLGKDNEEHFGISSFNISENPYGFTVPISKFGSISQFFQKDGEWIAKHEILGNSFFGINFDDWILFGELASAIKEITKSELYLDMQLRLGSKTLGTNGSKYSARIDFLNLQDCTYNNEPYDDTLKKYVPSDNPIKDGYYSTDGNGNYNYHSSTGDTQTITSYEYDNSTNSTQYITNNYYGGSGGNNSGGSNGTLTDLAINVGDIIFNIDIGSIGGGGSDSDPRDYLLPDSTLGALKTGFGFLDNPDTEQQGDGFISFLGGTFSYMPDDFMGIIMFGIAVIVVLGIISIVIKVVF